MDKIELIKKMVRDNPENASAWYLLGVEYIEQKMDSEALQAFSEALKKADDDLRSKVMEELARLSMRMQPVQQQQGNSTPHTSAAQNCPMEENDLEDEQEDIIGEYEQEEESENNLIPLRVIEGGGKHQYIDTEHTKQSVTFDDVGGLDDLKETIKMKIIKPFKNPGLFSKFKKKIGGGILLFGPPGCGKTFIAKATAGECNARFIPVHITDILNPYLGVSAQNVQEIFALARAKKPCVLFFDEVDTIGYSRSKLSSEHMRPIVDQLLSEIEGIDSSTDKLLIIAATNMPWDVDSAFKRPGRFDKTVFVPPPDQTAREAIFKLKLEGKPVSEDIDLKVLARYTELYSGADIENVIDIAIENVINEIMKTEQERPIAMKDLLQAIESTKPSTIEWLKTVKNYVKYSNQAGLYDDVERFLTVHKKIL